MAATDTQLSDAERLAIAREPGNEKLLKRELKRLTKQRYSIHDRRLKLKQDLADNALDLLRCDPDIAPLADVICALVELRQQFENEPGEGARHDATRRDFEDKAVLVAIATEPLEFLRKRLYGPVVE